MGITLDFSDDDLKGGDFSPIPRGTYTAEILDVELRESQRSDHPYYNVELEVSEGDYSGRKLWAICSTHPKARGMFAQTLLGMGCTEDELKGGGDYDPEAEWPGQTVHVVVKIGENQDGEPRNEVKRFYLPRSDGEKNPTNGPAKKSSAKKSSAKRSTRRGGAAF